MRRIEIPAFTYKETIEKCGLGIKQPLSLLEKLNKSKEWLFELAIEYENAAKNGNLHDMLPMSTLKSELGPCSLSSEDLKHIYSERFRKKGKPARKIYDYILNLAQDKCPFCGGIGTPSNLDHFLPIAHYPQFSVFPRNLVPACRDCNMGQKKNSLPSKAGEQLIHPYFDKDLFFIDQWIFATYRNHEPSEPFGLGEFSFFTRPPSDWCEVDKLRVLNHFDDVGLARRYAIKSAEQLAIVLAQIKGMRDKGANNFDIQGTILQPVIDAAPFANHWQKIMSQALTEYLMNST